VPEVNAVQQVPARNLRLVWGTTLILATFAFAHHLLLMARGHAISPNRVIALGVLVLLLLVAGIALVTVKGLQNWVLLWLASGAARLRSRLAGGLLSAAAIALFPVLVFGPAARWFELYSTRLLLFWLLILAASAGFAAVLRVKSLGERLLFAGLVTATLHLVATYVPAVSAFPLSLGWSEGSRYYFASLFFSNRVYGVHLPWPVLHPSRYLLQSVPFAFGDLPLWFHRLWQVLLWLGMALAGALAIRKRIRLTDGQHRAMFVLWGFLFLLQGPVYYHLIPCAMIVLLGFDSSRPLRSLILVVLASLWAGISRINWVPVPAFLAVTLYILEGVRNEGSHHLLRYWMWPALWVVIGGLNGLVSNAVYALLSGNPPQEFTSSFSSDLLWYRWLPNATFPIGILPGIALIAGPLMLALALRTGELRRTLDNLQMLALGGMLLTLFAGGAVVSTKIGGGGNLHNLDAYLVLLAVIGSQVLLKGRRPEDANRLPESVRTPPWLGGLIAAMPVLWTLTSGAPFVSRDTRGAEAALQSLRSKVAEAVDQGGEVLFMSERHLLTFGMAGDVPLVPEYEKTYLMEMAMSRNQTYLERFYQDLRQKRFALIVAEPMQVVYRGSSHSFGEEDDTWVRAITEPFLELYQPAMTLDGFGVSIYAPK
jgi:hypothetical protein